VLLGDVGSLTIGRFCDAPFAPSVWSLQAGVERRGVVMRGVGGSTIGAGIIAGALLVTLTTGITYATTSGSGAKACVNSKAVLRLLKSDGKCPSGYSKTTFGAQGPKGDKGVRGPKGEPGPAVAPHLYYDLVQSSASLPTSSVAPIATVAVPAGTYEVDFVVDIQATVGTTGAVCFTHTASDTDIAPYHNAELSEYLTGQYYGQSTGSDIFTVTGSTPTTLDLTCSDAASHASYDSSGSEFLSALPLGATN
jgi:hypothetical protein